MSKTGKLVASLIATQIIYGAYYLVSYKQIILPLPLNEIILATTFISAIYFEIKEIKKSQIIFLASLSLLEIFTSQFILRSLISVSNFERISQSYFFDILHFIKAILLTCLFANWLNKARINKFLIAACSILVGLVVLIPNTNILLTNIVVYSSILLLINQYHKNPTTNLWLLIVFEFMSTYWMTGTFLN